MYNPLNTHKPSCKSKFYNKLMIYLTTYLVNTYVVPPKVPKDEQTTLAMAGPEKQPGFSFVSCLCFLVPFQQNYCY